MKTAPARIDKAFVADSFGREVDLICNDDNCAVIKVANDTGEGIMTIYAPFPGVYVAYNDYHLSNYDKGFSRPGKTFCIDHCREGRIEWHRHDSLYCYFEAGDLLMSVHPPEESDFALPLKRYHGISIAFCLDEMEGNPDAVLSSFPIDLDRLIDKYCAKDRAFIARGGSRIDHVFSELYAIPNEMRPEYVRIKTLEILLFLSTMEVSGQNPERPYFYKNQVDKAKAIMELITAQPEKHYSLKELSERFDFPLTSMKKCFKGVYGTSIYAFAKEYRMNAAALMLRDRNLSITEVASRIGYDNASKFSAAFRSVIGETPRDYRRNRN